MASAAPRWGGVRTILLFLPSWISYLVRTMSWLPVLGKNGVVNTPLLGAGVVEQPLPLLYNHFTVYLGLVHYLLPIIILNTYLGLATDDPATVAAAPAPRAHRRPASLPATAPPPLPAPA